MPVPQKSASSQEARTTLRDVVREKIRAAILDGTFEPGEVLHDSELQDWLEVSRTPVRDALNDLERIGLIEMEPNRYTRVALPNEHEILDALRTLGVLLGGASRLALPQMDAAARDSVVGQIDRAVACLRAEDYDQLNIETISFFSQLVNNCHNPFLEKLCRDALDGLAYKLRIAAESDVIDFGALPDRFLAVKDAVGRGDAVELELAIEALHMIPRD